MSEMKLHGLGPKLLSTDRIPAHYKENLSPDSEAFQLVQSGPPRLSRAIFLTEAKVMRVTNYICKTPSQQDPE